MLAAGASGVAVIVPCKIRDRTIVVDYTGCYVKTGGPKARTAELCRIRISRISDCHFHHHDFWMQIVLDLSGPREVPNLL